MRRRRPTPPGVTAAATTAVFATGEGPGVTALATTAVLATGWPMTPTLPTRAGLTGMSVPFGCVGPTYLNRELRRSTRLRVPFAPDRDCQNRPIPLSDRGEDDLDLLCG